MLRSGKSGLLAKFDHLDSLKFRVLLCVGGYRSTRFALDQGRQTRNLDVAGHGAAAISLYVVCTHY